MTDLSSFTNAEAICLLVANAAALIFFATLMSKRKRPAASFYYNPRGR